MFSYSFRKFQHKHHIVTEMKNLNTGGLLLHHLTLLTLATNTTKKNVNKNHNETTMFTIIEISRRRSYEHSECLPCLIKSKANQMCESVTVQSEESNRRLKISVTKIC